MPTYVIRRSEDGRFVAPAGSEKSYTWKLSEARRFCDRDSAKRECCGNEYVVDTDNIMQPLNG